MPLYVQRDGDDDKVLNSSWHRLSNARSAVDRHQPRGGRAKGKGASQLIHLRSLPCRGLQYQWRVEAENALDKRLHDH